MVFPVQHVLAATDFSAASWAGLRAARHIAETADAQLTVLHVHDPMAYSLPEGVDRPERSRLESSVNVDADIDAALKGLLIELGPLPSAEAHVIKRSSVATAICDYADAHKVDMIVISTHGRTGISRLLIGSVTERVVRLAPCPVLVVPSD